MNNRGDGYRPGPSIPGRPPLEVYAQGIFSYFACLKSILL